MKCLFVKIVFFLFAVALVGCKVERPEGVIAPEKMEALLYDYHLAQAVTSDEVMTSYKKKMHINYVFDKHGVTKEAFDSSLVWYMRYPKHILRIYSDIEKKLLAEMETMGVVTAEEDAFNEQMNNAAEVNLWRGAKVKLLSSMALCNRLHFNYEADNTYKAGDSISLSFNVKFLPGGVDSVAYNAHAALVVEYDDATVATSGSAIDADGVYSIAVERNYNAGIKALNGFLFYTDDDSLTRPKLLVSDIAVMRVHPPKSK